MDNLVEMGVFEISFSGGKPLVLKKKLLNLGKQANRLGFHLNLATNATLITEETVDDLLNAGFHEIQVSVEGLEAHDRKASVEITFAVATNKWKMVEQKEERSITKFVLQVLWHITQNCNLKCSHCYEINVLNQKFQMSLEECFLFLQPCFL